MKNVIAVLLSLFIALTFTTLAQGARTSNEMVAEMLGSESVAPVPGATAEQVKKIVREEQKKAVAGINKIIKEENRKLLGVRDIQNDVRTGVAIEEQTKKFVESSKNNASKDDIKNTASKDDLKSIGVQNYKNTLIVGGLIGLLAIIMLLFLIFRNKNKKETAQPQPATPDRTNEILTAITDGVDKVVKRVDNIAVEVTEQVKKIDMTPLDFETENHYVIFQLEKDKNGLLKSICVPKSIKSECPDESIPTYGFDHRGKLFSKTLKIITAYLAGEYGNKDDAYSRMQTRAIEFAMRDGGPLKVVKS